MSKPRTSIGNSLLIEIGCKFTNSFPDFSTASNLWTRAEDYPVLMTQSDCDGTWTPTQLPQLRRELELIGERFRQLPAEQPQSAFEHTAEFRRGAQSLYDCFHNIDGEPVFEALIALCDEGIRWDRPILFQ